MTKATCSRCGSHDNPRPLPKKFACQSCGDQLLCYACDTSHNTWCDPHACGDADCLDADLCGVELAR